MIEYISFLGIYYFFIRSNLKSFFSFVKHIASFSYAYPFYSTLDLTLQDFTSEPTGPAFPHPPLSSQCLITIILLSCAAVTNI